MERERIKQMARDFFREMNRKEYEEARVESMHSEKALEEVKNLYDVAESAFVCGVFWALRNLDCLCRDTD